MLSTNFAQGQNFKMKKKTDVKIFVVQFPEDQNEETKNYPQNPEATGTKIER